MKSAFLRIKRWSTCALTLWLGIANDPLHAGVAPTCSGAEFATVFDRVTDDAGSSYASYRYDPGVDLGFGGPGADAIQLEFYGAGYGATGTFSLSTAPNDNYATCTICLLVMADIASGTGPAKLFYPREGFLTVTEAPGPTSPLVVSIPGIVVQEVTIDTQTFQSTPVPGGACYQQSATVFANGFEDIL